MSTGISYYSTLFIQQGLLHLEHDEYINALDCLHEAIRTDPPCLPARVFLAEMYEKLLDFKSSIEELHRIVSLGMETAEAQFALGHLDITGDDLSPEQHYTLAIDINPRFGLAYLYRGVQRVSQGRYADAIEDLTTAIRLEPALIEVYAERADLYERMGDFSNAIAELRQYTYQRGKTEAWVESRIAEYKRKLRQQ